jgi:branched-chain amino acid transport system ATP-binding protein
MRDPIDIIKAEHSNFDKVLHALEEGVCEAGSSSGKPDLETLFSIVYYIRVFPDKLHHPKEEQFLFPALRRRRPDSAPLVDELEQQHTEGERLRVELEQALRRCDQSWPNGYAELKDATRRYVNAQRRHIGTEERELLPLARECLSTQDWEGIQRAFAKNIDPLFGDNLETGFQSLFKRITASRPPGRAKPS